MLQQIAGVLNECGTTVWWYSGHVRIVTARIIHNIRYGNMRLLVQSQSVLQLATGWTVRESNPAGARFSAPIQNGSGAHPVSYIMDTGSFPGVKRPGRDVDHPPQSNAEVKEELELYLYSPSGPSWPVVRRTAPLRLPLVENNFHCGL
jgi:hypothetical protein